jgi:hypothetical protein
LQSSLPTKRSNDHASPAARDRSGVYNRFPVLFILSKRLQSRAIAQVVFDTESGDMPGLQSEEDPPWENRAIS